MFVSIKTKLINNVSRILVISFAVILLAVAGLNYQGSQTDLEKSLDFIRESLIAKAQTLVANNSNALQGMAEDNAFTAVQELVANTVKNDADISYGIYMDADLQPWVNASAENPAGALTDVTELSDPVSLWAADLAKLDFKEITVKGEKIIEFAAPVVIDDEILGFIRYGISTASMKIAEANAKESSRQLLIDTLMILALINAFAILICMNIVRRMAAAITNPIGSLNSEAEYIASGNYDSQVVVESNDEIGQLASNFDTMRVMIKKKIEDLATLNTSGEKLAKTTDKNLAYEEALTTLLTHCKGTTSELVLRDPDGNWSLARSLKEGSDVKDEQATEPSNITQWVIEKNAENHDIFFMEDFQEKSSIRQPVKTSVLVVPLADHDKYLGIICLVAPAEQISFSENDYEFAQTLARLLVITLNNISMREVIEEQNRTLEHKVEERTAALQEKTNDILSMMQNMHQGLFTIMRDGHVHHEYAAYCEEIFSTQNIAGRKAMDLLFSNSLLGVNALDQVSTAIDALVGEDEMMWDFNSHLLVTEYTIKKEDGEDQIIELDWDPIVLDGEIDKIMVTVRDVTELKALQAEAEEQRQELEMIGQILNLNETDFNGFIKSSHEFIDLCEDLIKNNDKKDLDIVANLFRNMHTVKGNARTYGLTYVTDSVHEVETTYDKLRKEEEYPWNQQQLLDELAASKKDVDRYKTVAVEKLGRGEGHVVQAPFDKVQMEQLIIGYQHLDTSKLPSKIQVYLSQVNDLLTGKQKKSLESTISPVLKSVKSLASELEKPEPNVNIEVGDLLFTEESQQPMQNIFTHLLRNSLDHGIEDPDVREQRGKPAKGQVFIGRKDARSKVVLTISDDGAGLPLHKLKKKLAENEGEEYASSLSATELANSIFSSGVSTAEKVTNVSGRGVGMEAVLGFIKERGGDMAIVLKDANATTDDFAPFEFELTIPNAFYSSMTPIREAVAEVG